MSVGTTIGRDNCGRGWRSSIAVWHRIKAWQRRLFLLVVAIYPIWLLDEPLARLKLREQPIPLLADIRDVTRQFGEPVGITWISVVLWFVGRSRRRQLLWAIVATLIASGLASGTKLLIGRERPKVSEGRTILTGPYWPGTMEPDASFPSGHAAVAFAFAFGLCQMYPQHRKLWLFLAAGCGVSRTLGEAHFLSDVVIGGWMGWEIARVSWEPRFSRWLMNRLDYRMADVGALSRWNGGAAGNAASVEATSVRERRQLACQ